MPRMVRPLAMVARISAPTRTRGRLPRPPVSATPASATAVSAVKMMAGLAAGLASVTFGRVDQATDRGADPGDHEPEDLVAVAVDAGAADRLGVGADRHQPEAVAGPGQEDRADDEDDGDDEDRRRDAGEALLAPEELALDRR